MQFSHSSSSSSSSFFFFLNLWLIMIHCQSPLWGKHPNAGTFLEVCISSSRLSHPRCLCRVLIYASNQCYCLSYKRHLCICMYFSLGQVGSGPETGADKSFQLSQRTDAFELWCWKRLLRVPWTTKRSNQLVLNIHRKDWCWDWSSNTLPPDSKSRLIRKDPDAGKDWR